MTQEEEENEVDENDYETVMMLQLHERVKKRLVEAEEKLKESKLQIEKEEKAREQAEQLAAWVRSQKKKEESANARILLKKLLLHTMSQEIK